MSYRAVPRGDFLGVASSVASAIPVVGSFLGPALGFLGGLFGGGPSPEEIAAAHKYLQGAIGYVTDTQKRIRQLGLLNSRLRPYGVYFDPVAKTLKSLSTKRSR